MSALIFHNRGFDANVGLFSITFIVALLISAISETIDTNMCRFRIIIKCLTLGLLGMSRPHTV